MKWRRLRGEMVGIVELAVAFYFADDMIMEGKGEERAWLIDFRSIFFTKFLHFNINYINLQC